MILSATTRWIGLAIFLALCLWKDVRAQDDMRLIYNINSGNVQVEILNPAIQLFSIETVGPAGAPGTGFLLFNNVNSSTAVGAPIATPPANQDTIAFLNASGPLPVGTVNLGNIMPPGITFTSTDGNDTLSVGTNSAGNTVGFGALAFTVTGSGSDQVAFTTVSTAVCGDINLDGNVNFLDIAPFIDLLTTVTFQPEADCDLNGIVNFLDIAPFIAALSAG